MRVQKAIEYAEHALGGTLNPKTPPVDVVNFAGQWLYDCHHWMWLRGRSTVLDQRASITITGATWVEGTLTLTSTALAGYEFSPGDRIQLTGGSGGDGVRSSDTINILSASGNDIVLESTLSVTPGSPATSVDAILRLAYWEVPGDVKSIIGIEPTSNLLRNIQIISIQRLQAYRSNISSVHPFGFYCAPAYARTGDSQQRILEIWPTPNSDEYGSVTLMYEAGWETITEDSQFIQLPQDGWLDMAFLSAVRAVALGLEEGDEASLTDRLAALSSSEMFMQAYRRDGSITRILHSSRGSYAQRNADAWGWDNPSLVPDPT